MQMCGTIDFNEVHALRQEASLIREANDQYRDENTKLHSVVTDLESKVQHYRSLPEPDSEACVSLGRSDGKLQIEVFQLKASVSHLQSELEATLARETENFMRLSDCRGALSEALDVASEVESTLLAASAQCAESCEREKSELPVFDFVRATNIVTRTVATWARADNSSHLETIADVLTYTLTNWGVPEEHLTRTVLLALGSVLSLAVIVSHALFCGADISEDDVRLPAAAPEHKSTETPGNGAPAGHIATRMALLRDRSAAIDSKVGSQPGTSSQYKEGKVRNADPTKSTLPARAAAVRAKFRESMDQSMEVLQFYPNQFNNQFLAATGVTRAKGGDGSVETLTAGTAKASGPSPNNHLNKSTGLGAFVSRLQDKIRELEAENNDLQKKLTSMTARAKSVEALLGAEQEDLRIARERVLSLQQETQSQLDRLLLENARLRQELSEACITSWQLQASPISGPGSTPHANTSMPGPASPRTGMGSATQVGHVYATPVSQTRPSPGPGGRF